MQWLVRSHTLVHPLSKFILNYCEIFPSFEKYILEASGRLICQTLEETYLLELPNAGEIQHQWTRPPVYFSVGMYKSSLVHLLYLILFLLRILMHLVLKMACEVKLLNIASRKNKLRSGSIRSLLLVHKHVLFTRASLDLGKRREKKRPYKSHFWLFCMRSSCPGLYHLFCHLA